MPREGDRERVYTVENRAKIARTFSCIVLGIEMRVMENVDVLRGGNCEESRDRG